MTSQEGCEQVEDCVWDPNYVLAFQTTQSANFQHKTPKSIENKIFVSKTFVFCWNFKFAAFQKKETYQIQQPRLPQRRQPLLLLLHARQKQRLTKYLYESFKLQRQSQNEMNQSRVSNNNMVSFTFCLAIQFRLMICPATAPAAKPTPASTANSGGYLITIKWYWKRNLRFKLSHSLVKMCIFSAFSFNILRGKNLK